MPEPSTLADKVKRQRGSAQAFTHPMTATAIEAQKEGRDGYKTAQKLAEQIWRDVTGIELPRLEPFVDKDGDLWVLAASVELRLVQRGVAE